MSQETRGGDATSGCPRKRESSIPRAWTKPSHARELSAVRLGERRPDRRAESVVVTRARGVARLVRTVTRRWQSSRFGVHRVQHHEYAITETKRATPLVALVS